MKCRKPYFQPVEASTSLLISRERCQYPPPEDSAPVYRRGRETTVTRPAGRLGQVNCFKGHHHHQRTFACCIVPLNEHCLITHTVNDILVVPWLLRAGLPAAASARAPALVRTTLQEKRLMQTLHRVWVPNNHPSTFACRLFIAGAGSASAATLSGSALLMGRRLFPI